MTMASVLTDDEAISLGFSPIVHAGEGEVANGIADALGVTQQDRDGRQIISLSQYHDLSRMDARLDGYAMRFTKPGTNKIWYIQASKYIKWYGAGYRPIGDPSLRSNQVRDLPRAPTEEPTAFYCRDKYPECKRFFDSKKGLDFHWRKDHKEVGFKGRQD